MTYITLTGNNGLTLPLGNNPTPIVNPIGDVYGGIQLNPINPAYINPLGFIPLDTVNPVNDQPINTPTLDVTALERRQLLDDLLAVSPLNPIKKTPIYERTQLDVPNLDNADLTFIKQLYQNPEQYMGGLDASNTYLFIVEVVDNLIKGLNVPTATVNAISDIKGNIYLYNPDGTPIKPGPNPLTYNPSNDTANGTEAAKNKTLWVWIAAVTLLLLANLK